MIGLKASTTAEWLRLNQRVVTGVGWSLIGTIFGQGSTFLVNVASARLFGREVFGEYVLAQNAMVAFVAVTGLGTTFTATKYLAEFRTSNPERAGRILAMCYGVAFAASLFGAVLLWFVAPVVADKMYALQSMCRPLRLISGMIFFTGVTSVQIGALAGLERYRSLAKSLVAGGSLYALCGLLGAYFQGLNGLIVGLLLSSAVQCAILHVVLDREAAKQGIRIRWGKISEEYTVLVHFAFPAALAGFTQLPSVWAASALLAREPGGVSQIALFSAASNVKLIVLYAPLLLNRVTTSVLNNQAGMGQEEDYWRLFWNNFVVVVAAVVGAALVAGLGGSVILGVFGPQFRIGRGVLSILMLAACLEGSAWALYQSVQSQGRMWYSLLTFALPRDVALILLAIVLVRGGKAEGLAWAYVGSWTLCTTAIGYEVLSRYRRKGRARSLGHVPGA